jgi:hypothetical protein
MVAVVHAIAPFVCDSLIKLVRAQDCCTLLMLLIMVGKIIHKLTVTELIIRIRCEILLTVMHTLVVVTHLSSLCQLPSSHRHLIALEIPLSFCGREHVKLGGVGGCST